MQTKKNDNKYDQTESNQTANNEQTESIVKWDPQASASSTIICFVRGPISWIKCALALLRRVG